MLRTLSLTFVYALFGSFVLACSAIAPQSSRPSVIISSPPGGSVYTVGQQVAVQSTSTDSAGVIRVALVVDGVTVREDPSPVATGQQQYSLIQNWVADKVGQHNVIVRATNAQGIVSDTGIYITVQEGAVTIPNATSVPAAAQPTNSLVGGGGAATSAPVGAPTSTASLAGAGATCTDIATFVADLSIPDGTNISPSNAFTKSWHVRNGGTCNWQNYSLDFVSGVPMTTATKFAVPATAPGATADLSILLAAPATFGSYTGTWQLRNAGGTLFGPNLTVVINVPSPLAGNLPTATATSTTSAPPPTIAGGATCSGQPNNFTFTASKTAITAGQSVTLNWGAVNNASIAVLNGGSFSNQGVPAPGSLTDSPTATTTYTLTATCSNGGGTRTKSVTVTVSGSAPPAAKTSTPTATVGAACSNPTIPIGGFFASPATIASGQSATVTWNGITGADKITLKSPAGTQTVGTLGSKSFTLTSTTTFVLTAGCSTSVQAVATQVTVTVTGAACSGPITIASFTASATTIKAGQVVTLFWGNITNADDFRLYSGGTNYESVGAPAQRNRVPTTTTTYQLAAICSASGAGTAKSLTITVTP